MQNLVHNTEHEQILSDSNISHLCNLCERFFNDKYNIIIAKDALNKMVPLVLNKIINYYKKNPPLLPLPEINKIAMQRIKDFVLKNNEKEPGQLNTGLNTSLSNNDVLPTPISGLDKSAIQPMKYEPYDLYNKNDNFITPNINYVPNEVVPIVNTVTNTAVNTAINANEDDFIYKLKNLENTRNIITTNNEKEDIIENFLSPASPINSQTYESTASASAAASASASLYETNFRQQKTLMDGIRKSVIINALDRDWIYFHERYLFNWSGAQIESLFIKISYILLPRRVAKNTPIVILEITGSSNKTIEVVLVLHTRGVTWDTWKCINDEVIQNISCPWTIKLLDSNHIPLDILGKDGSIIKSTSHLYNNNTQIVIEPHMNCIEAGHQLQVYNNTHDTNNKTKILNVVNVSGRNIEVSGDITNNDNISSIVCNMCCQPYIIIEYSVKAK
jgi:hypothetical protein